jgi:hypothetical protein
MVNWPSAFVGKLLHDCHGRVHGAVCGSMPRMAAIMVG